MVYHGRFSRVRPHLGRGRLQRGDKVTATARKLEDVADLKESFGDAVLPLALDVTNPEQVQQAFNRRTSISAGWMFL